MWKSTTHSIVQATPRVIVRATKTSAPPDKRDTVTVKRTDVDDSIARIQDEMNLERKEGGGKRLSVLLKLLSPVLCPQYCTVFSSSQLEEERNIFVFVLCYKVKKS